MADLIAEITCLGREQGGIEEDEGEKMTLAYSFIAQCPMPHAHT